MTLKEGGERVLQHSHALGEPHRSLAMPVELEAAGFEVASVLLEGMAVHFDDLIFSGSGPSALQGTPETNP